MWIPLAAILITPFSYAVPEPAGRGDAATKTVGLNYWDVVNNKQVAEGSVTVDADATIVNTSTFTDIPTSYELLGLRLIPAGPGAAYDVPSTRFSCRGCTQPPARSRAWACICAPPHSGRWIPRNSVGVRSKTPSPPFRPGPGGPGHPG